MLVADTCTNSSERQCLAILGKGRSVLLTNHTIGRGQIVLGVEIGIFSVGIGIFATGREISSPHGVSKHQLACSEAILDIAI